MAVIKCPSCGQEIKLAEGDMREQRNPSNETASASGVKKRYGEFENVLLTDKEYEKLHQRSGDEADTYIEKLSAYLASKRKRYLSHYAVILNWQRRDKERGHGKNTNPRDLPKSYSKPAEYDDP